MAKVKLKKDEKPSKNPYKPVDSDVADAIRKYAPLPTNMAQAAAKVLGDARMSEKSLTDKQKVILHDVIQNAMRRSGEASGGTEYEDYGNLGYGTPHQFNQWFNKGRVGAPQIIEQSALNEGFKLASTIGRGRYWTDEKNPDIIYYTDVYDWNPKERRFSGTNAYQAVRNFMRTTEDKHLNKDKNEMYRMNFKLSKKEIAALRKNLKLNLADSGD